MLMIIILLILSATSFGLGAWVIGTNTITAGFLLIAAVNLAVAAALIHTLHQTVGKA